VAVAITTCRIEELVALYEKTQKKSFPFDKAAVTRRLENLKDGKSVCVEVIDPHTLRFHVDQVEKSFQDFKLGMVEAAPASKRRGRPKGSKSKTKASKGKGKRQ
jgi:hypothetical protein